MKILSAAGVQLGAAICFDNKKGLSREHVLYVYVYVETDSERKLDSAVILHNIAQHSIRCGSTPLTVNNTHREVVVLG